MKKRFAIVNFTLTVAVLFSMLFQSVHSIEHFATELSEEKCIHRFESKHEITHKHHDIHHCFVCDFSFAGYISPEILTVEEYFAPHYIPYFFASDQIFPTFQGNSSLLRGPPGLV